MIRCETCGEPSQTLNDADQCRACHDAYAAAQIALWRPVFEGERRAGLHGEYTREGLQMRLNEMSGSREVADWTRRTSE